jgi:hypothetical protein
MGRLAAVPPLGKATMGCGPMNRRRFFASVLGTLLGGCHQGEEFVMAPPEKVRLIPDIWHIHNAGRLHDGRLFFVDGQLDYANGVTRDFVCTFIFDVDGHLVEHSIESIGERGKYPDGSAASAMNRHLAALGDRTLTDIWVRPFSIESNGTVFGLISRQARDGSCRVEFMPGNTMSFYPPWEAGEYDT